MNEPRNWSDPVMALRAIQNYLNTTGLTLKAQALYMDCTDKPRRTRLPGYTVFDVSDGIRASDWAVPGTRQDVDDIMYAYEAYVDRDLGKIMDPGKVAKMIWPNGKGLRYLGPKRSRWHWWVPAVQIVSAMAKVTGAAVEVGADKVFLDLGGDRMVVTPTGCWSNYHKRIKESKAKADDAKMELLTTAPRTTFQPLAGAMELLGAPLPILWATNALTRAAALDECPPITVHSLEYVASLRGKAKPKPRSKVVADVIGAVAAAREALEGFQGEGIAEIHQALVPRACSSAEFYEAVTNPFEARAKALTPEMKQRVEDLLASIERSISKE